MPSLPIAIYLEAMHQSDPAVSASAESAHRSATITELVAIRGGGLPIDLHLNNSWVAQPEEIDGRRFVHLMSYDPRCRAFFNYNFDMVNHIKSLRDRKVMELMLASSVQDEDPNEPNPVAQTTPTRPKRELIDLIPKIIDIEVETRTGVQATVSVISTWKSRMTLQIELSEDNLDLLLEEPPAVSAPFIPNLAEFPHTSWVGFRKCVRTSYWDSKQGVWKIKSQIVNFENDDTIEEKEAAVFAAAAALQEFFNRHHDRDGNCNTMSCTWESSEPAKRQRTEDTAGSAQSDAATTDD